MKNKSLVDFPYNYQFDIGERVMFYGEKMVVVNVVDDKFVKGDQKLYLECDDESGVIIYKDDNWNIGSENLMKLIIRGVE